MPSVLSKCRMCKQEFGTTDKRSQVEKDFKVERIKSTQNECKPCGTVRIRSFEQEDAGDLLTQFTDQPKLEEKFDALCCENITFRLDESSFGSKQKHEKVDKTLYTEKKDETYVDWQRKCAWLTTKVYLASEFPKKRFANETARSRFTKETLGLEIEENDEGVLGVIVDSKHALYQQGLLCIRGRRLSVAAIKKQVHEKKENLEVQHESNKSTVQVRVYDTRCCPTTGRAWLIGMLYIIFTRLLEPAAPPKGVDLCISI
jgi:hypothetical protein